MLHFCFWPNEIDEGEEGYALPTAIELAPSGDAVKIAHVFKLRECIELLPGKGLRILDQAANLEAPVASRNFRTNPEIEHGKAGREMLPGRQPAFRTDGRLRFPAHLAGPAFRAGG